MTEGGKDVHMLIITDHFTRYAQAVVASSQTAKCTTQALWDWFVVNCGLPESIVSDQGQNFKSYLISELCKLTKVWKLHTIPYHPQTNGQCEQFNHTLIDMLGTLPPNKKSSWWDMVPMLVHVYSCTRSTVPGLAHTIWCMARNPNFQSVYILVPIAQKWMPLQVLNLCENCLKDWSWHKKTGQHVTEKENSRHKQNYDHKIRCTWWYGSCQEDRL